MPVPPDLTRPTTARLDDGRPVYVRPLRATDVTMLQSGLERLSPDSRFQRFMSAMPNLSETQARYFADVDGVNHVAFGATDPANEVDDDNPEGLGIGTARYIRSRRDPSTADLAVTVVDDYQRLGLGGILLDRLLGHARHNDVRTLTATMFTENRAIRALLESRGFTITTTDDAAVVEGRLEIAPADAPE